MITMMNGYAKAVQREIERDVDRRIVVDHLIDRPLNLRHRLGYGLIQAGKALTRDRDVMHAA